MYIIAALSLGFLGSFHCIGMCGPIAMALPVKSSSKWLRVLAALVYNAGRITTYFLIGLFFGLLGKGIYIGGLQQLISIVAGISIILLAIVPLKFKSFSPFALPWVRRLTSVLFNTRSFPSYFALGLLNGLLPCGFVYMALTGALLSGGMLEGSLFMAFFGLGTVPAMLAMSMIGSFMELSLRNRIRQAIPYLSVCVGLILIIRGLNLGIPYLSPSIQQEGTKTEVSCCHKP